MAPLIASNNPDGLKKSAQQLSQTKEAGIYHPPFPDYTVTAIGNSPLSGMIALALGVLVTFLVAYVISEIIKRRKLSN
jgi:cobalt/nickel transport protein